MENAPVMCDNYSCRSAKVVDVDHTGDDGKGLTLGKFKRCQEKNKEGPNYEFEGFNR